MINNQTKGVDVNLRNRMATAATLALATTCLIMPLQGVVSAAPIAAGGSSLQTALKHYSSSVSYQATVTTTTTLQPLNGSQPNVINSTMSLAYKAPNLMRVQTAGLMGGTTVVSDGKTMSSYLAMTNQYMVMPAPKRSLSSFIMSTYSPSATKLAGHASIGGKVLDKYITSSRLQGQAATTTIYVDPAAHTVNRITIVIPKISGPQGGGVKVSTEEDFQAQRFNPSLPASLFRFTPPAGAQRGSGAGLPTILGMPGGGTP